MSDLGTGNNRYLRQPRPTDGILPIKSDSTTYYSCGDTRTVGRIWIALGANIPGAWGSPLQSLEHAVGVLQAAGLHLVGASRVYVTAPLGSLRQPKFFNIVIVLSGSIGPAELLRTAKMLERAAGRRPGPRWGPRPIDIDILDYAGRRIGGFEQRTLTGRLQLPHPEMHRRGFVLVPLAELAPHWRHPVLGATAKAMLGRRPGLRRGVRDVGRFRE